MGWCESPPLFCAGSETARDIFDELLNDLSILAQIKEALKHDSIKLNDFQILAGQLHHASFAMPAGWGLFSPLSMAMAGSPKYIKMLTLLKETLQDWGTVVRQLCSIPTHVLQPLTAAYPDYLGYSD